MERRRFVIGVMAAAPTLTVTGRWLMRPALSQEEPGPVIPSVNDSDFEDLGDQLLQASLPTMPLLSIAIDEAGIAQFALPRQEVGQGINTFTAMLIAEELGVQLDRVNVTLEDARSDLAANQLTGGSYNARVLYQPVSKMAAGAREAMAATAARELGVPRSALSLADGVVSAPDGRALGYGELSVMAAALAEQGVLETLLQESEFQQAGGVPGGASQQLAAGSRPNDPDAKPVSEHTVIGTWQPRVDARAIATGTKKYTIDLLDVAPEAMPVMVAHSPRIRSTLLEFGNEEEIRAMPGVIEVKRIRAVPQFGYGEDPQFALGGDTAIAVMAETMGHAYEACEAIVRATDAGVITWTDGPVGQMSDQDFWDDFRAQAQPPAGQGDTVVELAVEWAHTAHAPMETMDAVCKLNDDGSVEVWSGLKIPQPAQDEIAEVLGLPPGQVVVHCVDSGGSFGRRLFHETALEAAVAAVAFGRSVRLKWSRREDYRNDRLRPACLNVVRGTISGGAVTSMETQFTGGSTNFSHGLGDALTQVGAHDPATQVLLYQDIYRYQMPAPYNYGLYERTALEIDYNMLTGSWRSVYTGTARTVEEMVAELMAIELGEDPLEFRRRRAKSPQLERVIAWMQENAGWGRADLPAGTFQGFAANSEHRSHQAVLVELEYDAEVPHRSRVRRAVMCADLGIPVNLAGIEGQMLSQLGDGIATVLRASVHIENGAVQESSYSEWHYPRTRHYPTDVQMHIMPAFEGAGPGGFGEIGVPTTAAAIANALYYAEGQMRTRFPLNHDIEGFANRA